MRSSLHPELFAAAYRVAAYLADLCGLSLPVKAELLLSTPKVTQAVSAALLDCYTWKLVEKVYGGNSRTALIAVCHHPVISSLNSGNLMLCPFSLQYRYAARGSGFAQHGRCPIASKPLSPQSPSTTGLGIGQHPANLTKRANHQLQPKAISTRSCSTPSLQIHPRL